MPPFLRSLAAATALAAGLLAPTLHAAPSAPASLDEATAAGMARLALDCVHKPYPNKIQHILNEDADARTPRQLYPAFYGCYDWHSSVHGHWLLARLAQLYPHTAFAAEARAALAQSLSSENLAGELAYFQRGDQGFQRPYGLAWLMQLGATLRQWDLPEARQWVADLAPLEAVASQRVRSWLPNLTYPMRVGEHAQTAFAFGLMLDWARQTGDTALADLLVSRSRDFYLGDTNCPLAYEPSGHDFLSPCLAEADLMRRILPPREFAAWLDTFLPQLPRGQGSGDWLKVSVVLDKSDGKLAHLDGLNLSRAWMLEGMVRGLPANDARLPGLRAAAQAHREAGMGAFTDMHYMGSHWLGTYAVYLLAPPGA